jgi:hypothetical protein
MNKEFAEWLAGETLPMFDIRRLSGADLGLMDEAYLVIQTHPRPRKEIVFECELKDLRPLILHHFPRLRTTVGEMAIDRCISQLELHPWWGSAGPMTEELRRILLSGVSVLYKSIKPLPGT